MKVKKVPCLSDFSFEITKMLVQNPLREQAFLFHDVSPICIWIYINKKNARRLLLPSVRAK